MLIKFTWLQVRDTRECLGSQWRPKWLRTPSVYGECTNEDCCRNRRVFWHQVWKTPSSVFLPCAGPQNAREWDVCIIILGSSPALEKAECPVSVNNIGLGTLSERYGAYWGQMLLVWENLGKSENRGMTSHSYKEATGNRLVGPKLVGAEPQGITRVGQTVWARLRRLRWLLPVGSVGGGAHQRNNGLCQHFCLGRKLSPSLLSCMSLIPFNPLPLCWGSEGVSLSKSMCWPFKWNCLKLPEVSVFHNLNLPCFLQPEVTETYLPGTGALTGGPGMGLGPLAPEKYLLIFIYHIWVWV